MSGPRVQKSQQRNARPFERLEQSKLLPQLIEKLEKGGSFNSVAAWMQKEGECKDVATLTLSKQINRFWKAYGESQPNVSALVEANRQSDIDEIARLEALADLQKQRIDQLRATEVKLPTLFPNFRQDIAEYRTILHTLIDKKRSLGLYGDHNKPPAEGGTHLHLTQNNITQNVTSLPERMRVMLSDDKKRRKLLNVVEHLTRPNRTPEEAFAKRYHVGTRDGDEDDVTPGKLVGEADG